MLNSHWACAQSLCTTTAEDRLAARQPERRTSTSGPFLFQNQLLSSWTRQDVVTVLLICAAHSGMKPVNVNLKSYNLHFRIQRSLIWAFSVVISYYANPMIVLGFGPTKPFRAPTFVGLSPNWKSVRPLCCSLQRGHKLKPNEHKGTLYSPVRDTADH